MPLQWENEIKCKGGVYTRNLVIFYLLKNVMNDCERGTERGFKIYFFMVMTVVAGFSFFVEALWYEKIKSLIHKWQSIW